ncbi:MAG: PepSY-associated TM helix domain-containing protein [Pseudomonadota bacterium]
MVSKATPTKKESTPRRRLYRIHTWLGFHLAWFMSLILLTGTFAVIAHEIDWLLQPGMRVDVPDDRQRVSWQVMEQAAREHRPADTLVSLFEMPADYFAYRARMIDEYGRHYFLHIDQWTGDVTGVTSTLTVQRVLRDLHRYLFMPSVIGLPLVTSLAFVLAVSLYTGLKTTRKWRQAATRIRFHKRARVAVGDYHRAAGLWSSWFFIVVIVTGVWYLVEFGAAVSGNRLAPPSPVLAEPSSAFDGPTIEDAGLGTLMQAAAQAYPDLRPNTVYFPQRHNEAVSISGRARDVLVRDRANAVYLHPVDGSVIEVRRSGESPWPAYLNDLADPLHFGDFAGLIVKLIWFVFGLAMSSLSLTGVWLTWKRVKSISPSAAQWATAPILIATALLSIPWYERITGPAAPEFELRLEAQSERGISHELSVMTDRHGATTGAVRLRILAENGRPNVAAVTLKTDVKAAWTKAKLVPRGSQLIVTADLPADTLDNAESISARVDFRGGQTGEISWSLDQLRVTRVD